METIFKYVLYSLVILVVIGIVIAFKDRIMKLCLIPPCEKQTCDVTVITTSEPSFSGTVERYCDFCYQKAKDCRQDTLCYIVSYPSVFSQQLYIPQNNNICKYQCTKDTSTLYFTYNHISQSVIVGC
ncbi:MAG: hypothetical protein QXM68_03485 [Candidatus Aenigmatarchaeota archaeon]|nr:hypothetical protein [Candidatus Aenigmarchaeota archaeon]